MSGHDPPLGKRRRTPSFSDATITISRRKFIHREINVIEVWRAAEGDAPMLPKLLSQIQAEERMTTMSGDGAYYPKSCHEAISVQQAEAVFSTRMDVKP